MHYVVQSVVQMTPFGVDSPPLGVANGDSPPLGVANGDSPPLGVANGDSPIGRFGLDLTRLIRRCARAFSSLCNGDCGREAARLGIQLRDKHGTAAGPTACAIAIPTQPSSGQERRGEKHSVVALRHQTFLWRAFFTSAKVTREPLEN